MGPGSHSCQGAKGACSGECPLQGRVYCGVTGVSVEKHVSYFDSFFSPFQPSSTVFPLAVGSELCPASTAPHSRVGSPPARP